MSDDESGFAESESEKSEDLEEPVSDNEKKPSTKSNDVNEGKTVFIRNLSFDSTSDQLKELMSQFGPTEYCVLCINPLTERPKGTAFVKFVNKCDAESCLEEAESQENSGKFYLDGRQLHVSLAVSRDKIREINENKNNKEKDKRNLYLSKEGVIYPKSPAAAGVSQTDLAKRLNLESRKRKLLQNLHNFVSKTRLCIHNLPGHVDDAELKNIFQNAVKNGKIIECRVMKERKKNEKKFGKSKGFGFVEFAEHEHALRALRLLNNNPDIFTNEKRPIVEFSIENRVALNKKRHRKQNEQRRKENQSSRKTNDQSDETSQTTLQYAGAMTKPSDKPVKMAKSNKKLFEMSKALRNRGKKMRARKNEEKIKKMKVKNRKGKKEKNVQIAKKESQNDDQLERTHLKKRKSLSDDAAKAQKMKKRKKKKWFTQTGE